MTNAVSRSHDGSSARVAVWVLHMCVPMLLVWLFIGRPRTEGTWQHPPSHAVLIGAVAALAAGLAAAVGISARRLGDGRLFLVSVAFLTSAGFLGIHALATPKVLIAKSGDFETTVPIGLALAGVLCVVATFERVASRSMRIAQWAWWSVIAGLLGGWTWLVLSGTSPTHAHDPAAAHEPSTAWVALAAAVLLLVAALRLLVLYRQRRSVMLISLITAFVLLAEAALIAAIGRVWRSSWWEWHALLLFAYAYVVYSARIQSRAEGSSTALFHSVALESTVDDVRRDHTAALEELVAALDADQSVAGLLPRLAVRFDLTERQLAVLERSARALRLSRDQAAALDGLVTLGALPSVSVDENTYLESARQVAASTFPRLGIDIVTGDTSTSAPTSTSTPDSPAAITVPLVVRGHVAGAVVARAASGSLAEHEQLAITTLARQIGLALENARLYRGVEELFRSYMSPKVADSLLADPSQWALGGEQRQVSVLVADLAGFTPFAERHEPRDVVRMLNTMYEVLVPEILRHGGTITQFVGDAVMAVFNAPSHQPDHAYEACAAALACVAVTDAVAADHRGWPRFRVGVNSGPALTGNVGSTALHTYSAIGDTTNVSARIQTLAGEGQVVISEATRAALADRAVATHSGEVQLKGRAQPVTVHRLSRLVTA